MSGVALIMICAVSGLNILILTVGYWKLRRLEKRLNKLEADPPASPSPLELALLERSS
jgi:hypothetical protein